MSKAIWWGALFSLVVGGLLFWAIVQEPEGAPIPRPGDGIADRDGVADGAPADSGMNAGADGGAVVAAKTCAVVGPFTGATCGDGVVVAWVDDVALTSGPVCAALREAVGDPATLAPDVLATQGERRVEQAIDAALVARAAAARGLVVSDAEVADKLAARPNPNDAAVGEATRAEVRARLLERKWVEAVGQLEPSVDELRAELARAPERFGTPSKVTAEAWLARGNDEATSARAAAWKAALERGPGATPPEGVSAVPDAVFVRDGLEPGLEALLWGDGPDGRWLGPVATRAGLVIVKVTGRTPGTTPRFEDVQPALRVTATERRRASETARLLTGLREAATIVRCVR